MILVLDERLSQKAWQGLKSEGNFSNYADETTPRLTVLHHCLKLKQKGF